MGNNASKRRQKGAFNIKHSKVNTKEVDDEPEEQQNLKEEENNWLSGHEGVSFTIDKKLFNVMNKARDVRVKYLFCRF
jgi:hypothetical protein